MTNCCYRYSVVGAVFCVEVAIYCYVKYNSRPFYCLYMEHFVIIPGITS